jgi:hypothetical protein
MKRLLGRVVAALCFCMFLASAGYGKQLKAVYLKDGGVIDCRSFWQEDGRVMVLVNRDVLVDLSVKEVDMKRTFKARKRPAARKTAVRTAVPAMQATSPPAVTQGALPGPKSAHQAAPDSGSASAPVAASVPRPVPRLHVPPSHVTPPSAASAASGMLTIGMLLPLLLIIVLLIASFWRVFTKAGEAGWQSIIPLYNMFVLVKISGKPWWWFLLLFVPLVNIITLVLVQIALAERFDRGVLYGLGLAFLGFIFYPLLAFGNATYRQSAY